MTFGPVVEIARASDRAKTIGTIVLGFASDPLMRWTFPDAAVYLDVGRRFVYAFGGRAFDHDTAFVADGGKAAALWLPPGVEPDQATMEAIVGDVIGQRPEIADDAQGLFDGMMKYHPHEPHWYLPLIAADPQFIGQGLGAALMKHVLRKCDKEGMPAYLESSNPRNISLYERHGFRIIGEIKSGAAPLMTPMYRPAS